MNLLGYKLIEDRMINLFNLDKLPHALLFYGEKGIGKSSFAINTAKVILSGSKEGANKLDYKIKQGSHPDYCTISPDQSGKIGVEEIRGLIKFLHLTAVEGKYKVALIDTCDGMTISAANALLKVLEEPPQNTILMLTCNSIGKLLPTIRSRCHIIKVPTPDKTSFISVVKNYDNNVDCDVLYEMSRGSIGIALNILEHDAMDLFQSLGKQLDGGDLSEALHISQGIANNQNLWNLFSFLMPTILVNKVYRASLKGTVHCAKVIEKYDKSIALLADCEKLHLDKATVIATILDGWK